MKIQPFNITIRELADGYANLGQSGVTGYGRRLDIRPPYQREFIYKPKQQEAVIDTVRRGFPLNVMYWFDREDGSFEVIDGQQRTISICEFIEGTFSHRGDYFFNLSHDEKERIRGYDLSIYRCQGSADERLDWFRTINIAGVKLTDQELRNATYAGTWVTDAKRYFSIRNSAAEGIGGDYLPGSAIRQDYLARVLDWISGGDISGYMSRHQHDSDADEMREYFERLICWIETIFTYRQHRKHLCRVDWGGLYAEHGQRTDLDPDGIAREMRELYSDPDITNRAGIYPYMLDGDVTHLNIRRFPEDMRIMGYERQNGSCPSCGRYFGIREMQADHITPWHRGGKTEPDNLQMLCGDCHKSKTFN